MIIDSVRNDNRVGYGEFDVLYMGRYCYVFY